MSQPSDSSHVVVVGAGIVGIACAHYLSDAGYRITVVDKGTVAGACSHGNCGYICPSHVLPLAQPGAVKKALKSLLDPEAAFRVRPRFSFSFANWMWQMFRRCNEAHMLHAGTHLKAILDLSMTEYRETITPLVDAQFRETGLLFVLQTAAGMKHFEHEVDFVSSNFGINPKRINGADLPRLDPALKDGLAGAFLFEDDAFLNPARLAKEWAALLRQRGVEFLENTELRSIDAQDGQVVKVGVGEREMQPAHLVLAAGAWSPQFAEMLGCRIPIEPGKGYSVTMRRPSVCPSLPMLFPEHHVGATPLEDGYRLGSMMEFTGYDDSIPPQRIEQLRKSAEPYLVEPHTDVITEQWYGWRPMTWDSLPIIGRVPGLDNAVLATGHNMLGVSLAPATGRLVAEMIQGNSTHINSAAFSPARF